MSEIKPCPFCGGEAERLDIVDGENAGGSCMSCKRCFACSHVEFGRKENFVSRWNTRPAEAALTASLNRASDACASVQKERDELREMLGEAVQLIRDWCDWLNCEEPELIPDAADHEAMILQGMAEFLARYEALK